MELEHGGHRAQTSAIAIRRRRYLDEILAAILVEPFTREMGQVAAKLDAQTRQKGIVIATADLLIGVTALYHSFAVGTRNVRHFEMIPSLQVVR